MFQELYKTTSINARSGLVESFCVFKSYASDFKDETKFLCLSCYKGKTKDYFVCESGAGITLKRMVNQIGKYLQKKYGSVPPEFFEVRGG